MDRVDSLANDYGRLFLRMHRLLNLRMAEAGASLSRTKLLMFIQARPAVHAADIAEFFGYAPRSVTDAIDGLERDGLVRREADRRDRRAKWISISNEGTAAIAATEPLRLKVVEQIFGTLDKSEQNQLHGCVTKLLAAVERLEALE